MAEKHRASLPAGVATGLRLAFAALAVASAILGYIGLDTYLVGNPTLSFGRGPSDLIYYDLQLFFVQAAPLQGGSAPLPWPLALSRFTAPAVLVYAFAEIAGAVFATRARRARLRGYRDHAIVCGGSRAAVALAGRLRERGMRVITVLPTTEGANDRAVVGDARSATTLTAAGVARARAVYACLDDTTANVEVAQAVENLRAGGRPVKVYALTGDADLCTELKARRLSTPARGEVLVDFFNLEELAGRFAARSASAVRRHGPPDIVVVGTGPFGRSVLVEAARAWRIHRGPSHDRSHAVLIGPDAKETAERLRRRFPFLDEVCEVEAFDGSLSDLPEWSGRPPSGSRKLFLCHEDEEQALKEAFEAGSRWFAALDSIIVRLDRMAGLAEAFGGDGRGRFFDAVGGRLRIVDVVAAACDPELVEDDLSYFLAHAIHDHYLSQQLRRGAVLGATPALAAWEELPEGSRAANRAQAADIGGKVAKIGCLLALRSGMEERFEYRAGEIDSLAEREHRRWMSERFASGWSKGDVRDDAERIHPDLKEWSQLSETARDKDRDAVRALPAILADAGLAIIRINRHRGALPPPRPPQTVDLVPAAGGAAAGAAASAGAPGAGR